MLNHIIEQVTEIARFQNHFIHEIKAKGQDIIDGNVFLCKVMRF